MCRWLYLHQTCWLSGCFCKSHQHRSCSILSRWYAWKKLSLNLLKAIFFFSTSHCHVAQSDSPFKIDFPTIERELCTQKVSCPSCPGLWVFSTIEFWSRILERTNIRWNTNTVWKMNYYTGSSLHFVSFDHQWNQWHRVPTTCHHFSQDNEHHWGWRLPSLSRPTPHPQDTVNSCFHTCSCQ